MGYKGIIPQKLSCIVPQGDRTASTTNFQPGLYINLNSNTSVAIRKQVQWLKYNTGCPGSVINVGRQTSGYLYYTLATECAYEYRISSNRSPQPLLVQLRQTPGLYSRPACISTSTLRRTDGNIAETISTFVKRSMIGSDRQSEIR